MTSSPSLPSPPPRPSFETLQPRHDDEREALRAFWTVYETGREEARATLEKAAADVGPELLALLSSPPADRGELARHASEAERAALVDGNWERLLERMFERGWNLAFRGLDGAAWAVVVRAFRRSLAEMVHRDVRCRGHVHLGQALHGAALFVDTCVGAVALGSFRAAEARVRADREDLRDREHQLSLMEHRLEEERARYERLLDTAAEGVWRIDEHGRTIGANRRLASMLDYSVEEMVGLRYTDLIPTEETERLRAQLEREPDPPCASALTYLVRRDGSRLRVRVNGQRVRGPGGESRGGLALMTDDTERWQSRTALDALLQQLPALVWSTDRELRITALSTGLATLADIDMEALVGRRLPEALRAFGSDREVTDEHRRALAGETVGYPISVKGRKYSATVKPLVSADGRVEGTLGVALDVTEKELLEERLGASQRLEALGQLAGGVAHDFNNVLTVVQSHAAMLAEALEGEPEARDAVAIERAVARATRLTRQLLAVGRRQGIRSERVDVGVIVEEMQEMLQRLLGADVRLEHRRRGDGCCVELERSQLEQVILNLAVNARDAMPEGGRLMIETFARTVGPSEELPPGEYVGVTVTDTGVGMDEATQRRIFEPFFTTKGARGSGLGLATVYGIIAQSGGDIAVRSGVGEGTRFEISLPRVEPEAVPDPPTTVVCAAAPPSEGATVLVVEDDELVRGMVGRILGRAGFQVVAVADADAALEVARGRRVEVLLSDLVMPGLSGRQLADRLSASCPGTRAVFMSGYAKSAAHERGLLAADAAFLEKPFTPAGLVAAVSEALRRDAR